MRINVILVFLACALASCSEDESEQPQDNRIKPNPEDVTAIRRILNEESESQSKSRSARQRPESELEREAEAIYTAFWNPKNLKRYGKHEWDTELNADVDYLITQPELSIVQRKDAEWPVEKFEYMSGHDRI